MKHVVVIGGGHSGLVAAVRLAVAGLDVTVLEHAAHPGGAVSTKELTLPGFLHDAGAGFFPQTLASPAFARLPNVIGAVDWVNPDVPLHRTEPPPAALVRHERGAPTTPRRRRARAPDAWVGRELRT